MNLINTIDMMNSSDFKERFIAEYFQLLIRKEGLKNMLLKYKNNELPFVPNCSYELLYTQLIHMESYLDILEKRAEIEGISLSMEVCE